MSVWLGTKKEAGVKKGGRAPPIALPFSRFSFLSGIKGGFFRLSPSFPSAVSVSPVVDGGDHHRLPVFSDVASMLPRQYCRRYLGHCTPSGSNLCWASCGLLPFGGAHRGHPRCCPHASPLPFTRIRGYVLVDPSALPGAGEGAALPGGHDIRTGHEVTVVPQRESTPPPIIPERLFPPVHFTVRN